MEAARDWLMRTVPESHSAECQWCPVCRTVAALRSPEAGEQIAGVVTAAAGALAAVLRLGRAPAGRRPPAGRPPRRCASDPAGRGHREPRDRGRHRRHEGGRRRGRRGGRPCSRWCAAPTPGDVAGTEDAIAGCVAELAERYDVVAVGIGAAGWIANDRATVLFSPHLAWRDEPLRDALVGRIGLPVDGGERRQRRGLGASTGSAPAAASGWSASSRSAPGSAAGCVVAGTLYRGAYGHGRRVRATCRWCRTVGRCACGNRGCWEMYASGTALARDARELAEVSPVAAHRLLELAGGDPTALTGPLVTTAAAARVTRPRWRSSPRWGAGSAGGSPAWPRRWTRSVVVIGGGVSEAGELLLRPGAGGVRRVADRARVPPAGADPAGRARAGRRARRRRRPGPPPGLTPAIGGAADLARVWSGSDRGYRRAADLARSSGGAGRVVRAAEGAAGPAVGGGGTVRSGRQAVRRRRAGHVPVDFDVPAPVAARTREYLDAVGVGR